MGHADFEIEALFAKFDVDGDRILNEDEVAHMKEELEEDEVCIFLVLKNLRCQLVGPWSNGP